MFTLFELLVVVGIALTVREVYVAHKNHNTLKDQIAADRASVTAKAKADRDSIEAELASYLAALKEKVKP